MKHNELLKELEKRMSRYGYCDTWTHIEFFIKEYEALTKDEKPIRLKDVIKRIKEFDNGTKFKWTYDILKELGSDFASKVFHEGYQQGRFDEGIENYYRREKIKVPQFVADWYEEHKDNLEFNIFDYVYRFDQNAVLDFKDWFDDFNTKPIQTLVNMHQFGYEVEEEKRYLVKLKGIEKEKCYLNYNFGRVWLFYNQENFYGYRAHHTRKELEEAGFGEVFNSPLFEVEEVEE